MNPIANTSQQTVEPVALPILREMVERLEGLRLLEAIYGYADGKACNLTLLANELTEEQQDSIWSIYWEFQAKYPQLDIDILLLPRNGRPASEILGDISTATIKREFANV